MHGYPRAAMLGFTSLDRIHRCTAASWPTSRCVRGASALSAISVLDGFCCLLSLPVRQRQSASAAAASSTTRQKEQQQPRAGPPLDFCTSTTASPIGRKPVSDEPYACLSFGGDGVSFPVAVVSFPVPAAPLGEPTTEPKAPSMTSAAAALRCHDKEASHLSRAVSRAPLVTLVTAA